jgi:uncharacterized protein
MRPLARLAVLFALAAAWAGCATPRSAFYTLAASAKAGPASASFPVRVGPVSVPEIVDRPQFVVRTGPNRVSIDEFNRWASPLRDDIARVVALDLASLLGNPMATAGPLPGAEERGYRVRIDVMAFESEPGEAAVLDAAWTVRSGKEGMLLRWGRSTVREGVRGPGRSDLAAAHSLALGKMSADIADAIRAMEGAGGEGSARP